VLILASILLGEKVTVKQLGLCCFSFLGALFICKPTFLKLFLGLEIEPITPI